MSSGNMNSAGPLSFDGRVAIITGAARGLGREYALLLASRGASLVVNDLGGSRDGLGKSSAADEVVQEIINKGGKAVADYHSVEDGEKIVKTALDNFGRLDILINNAGILRDKSILKMTEDDWDLVHRVHLRGSFLVTKAAWPHFREQTFGRIVMTSSPAGIYGNFGQANYSSAKLGLLSLAKTLAVEGDKYNIRCNTIVPVAASRLTEDLMPEDIAAFFQPQYVAPMVGFLCHESCPTNGGVFESAGGFYGQYNWQRSNGKVFPEPQSVTVEDIRDSWTSITDMSKSSTPTSIQDHMMKLIQQLQGEEAEASSTPEDSAFGSTENLSNTSSSSVSEYTITNDNAILYALSVGVTTGEKGHQNYINEFSTDFGVLPTMATSISLNAIYDQGIFPKAIEEYKLEDNFVRTLHGEQYLKMHQQSIPMDRKLTSRARIIDVLDKGSGALIITQVDTFDPSGQPVFTNQLAFFMVGSGDFGGRRQLPEDVAPSVVQCVEPPNREPDAVVLQRTTPEQAALFRLVGDKNPLHIDPNISLISGYPRPILHGLCTLGFAVRHAVSVYANYAADRLDQLKCRFVGVLIPGETIETRLWRETVEEKNNSTSSIAPRNNNNQRIYFEAYNRETGKKLVTGGFVDLNIDDSLPQSSDAKKRVVVIGEESEKVDDDNDNMVADDKNEVKCKIDDIFSGWLVTKIQENESVVKHVNTVYQFNITKEKKHCATWTLDLKNLPGDVYRGTPKRGAPDCTLTVDDEVITNIFKGKEDAMQAFMSGQLKVSGNILAAQKLQQIWSENGSKEESADGASASSPLAGGELSQQDKDILESIPSNGLKCDIVFTIFRNRKAEEPELVKKLIASYQFEITVNGKVQAIWTAENKTDPTGAIYKGPFKLGKPDCLVRVDDEDLTKLLFGKLNPQRAFMLGKLKVKGNIMLLQRVNTLWLDLQKSGKAPELPYLVDLVSQHSLIPGLKSEMIVVELVQRLIRLPYLTKEVASLVGFEITKDGKTAAEYTVDFTKNANTGIFNRGLPPAGKNYCVLTLKDEDFALLTYHRFTLEEGIDSGRIKVRGDTTVPRKVSILFKLPTSRAKL